jgi:hypothetical protein
MPSLRCRMFAVLLIGIALGSLSTWLAERFHILNDAAAAETSVKKLPDLATINADLAIVKGKVPDQSHAMTDVAMQFSNLWFAGEKENWPLADFFWSETRSHLAWAVRIIPKRKDNAGREIDLPAILQALENSPLKDLGAAIKAKDRSAFERAYRFTIDGCYSCHKAADKPYLRPQIPTAPALPIVNFDPQADWPK